jgi:hypothetical protein
MGKDERTSPYVKGFMMLRYIKAAFRHILAVRWAKWVDFASSPAQTPARITSVLSGNLRKSFPSVGIPNPRGPAAGICKIRPAGRTKSLSYYPRQGELVNQLSHKRIRGAQLALLIVLSINQLSQGQAFRVIHSFTGGDDGASPESAITLDMYGNLYGSATYGGPGGTNCAPLGGCGVIFRLTSHGSGWIFSGLFGFKGENDGALPAGHLAISADGSVYGTTSGGGTHGPECGVRGNPGCGKVFKLTPGGPRIVVRCHARGAKPFSITSPVAMIALSPTT